MKKTSKGLLLVIISGIVFGVMPGAVKFCISQGATKELMVLSRYVVLSVVLLPVVLRQKNTFRIYGENFFKFLLLSAAGVATSFLLYSAYDHLDTGLTTTIHFLYPAAVAVLSLLILKIKLSGYKLLCLVLCIAGVLLMLDVGGGEISMRGILTAALSSVTWAFYIVLLQKYDIKGASGEQIMFYVAAGSAALMALYSSASGGFAVKMAPLGIAGVVGASVLISVCGSLFFAIGVRSTDAQTAAIAGTLEPITSIGVGVLFLHEVINVRTGIGCFLILTAVVLLALKSGSRHT